MKNKTVIYANSNPSKDDLFDEISKQDAQILELGKEISDLKKMISKTSEYIDLYSIDEILDSLIERFEKANAKIL